MLNKHHFQNEDRFRPNDPSPILGFSKNATLHTATRSLERDGWFLEYEAAFNKKNYNLASSNKRGNENAY